MKTKSLVDVRRSGERFHTQTGWLDSWHSFSFGRHYDPDNLGQGLLIVNNEDIVHPGTGFQTHRHQDMEIVTWVLSGELEHKDSAGNKGIIFPGLAQRMSAGSGIWHSEVNPNLNRDVHLIQMWVMPDEEGIAPDYQQSDVNVDLKKGGLVRVASGRNNAAIQIHQKAATLWIGRLKPGETVKIPEGEFVHLFVAKGSAEVEEIGTLTNGDAARLNQSDPLNLKADVVHGSEILVWQMD